MACNPYGILPPYFMRLLDPIAQRHGVSGIGELNDYYRHEIVLQVLEEAIIECSSLEGGNTHALQGPESTEPESSGTP